MTPETLAPALVKILEPGLGTVEVDNLRILTGGASRATWAFDAVTATGPRALILRTGPPDEVHAGMLLEARAQALAAAAGAPVPEVITADESTAALGAPFLIGGFIAGETIPRRILRTLDDGSRARLLGQCAAALVAIHRADITATDIPEQDQTTTWRAFLDEMGDTTATFEWAFRWLELNRPAPTDQVLVHGDFRMGNLIIDIGSDGAPANLAAVLDWELTHTGQAVEDLAWFCIRAWRFGAPRELGAGGLGSFEDFLAAYEEAGGAPVDRTAFHWWLVLETLRWGVICRYQAHRHLSGQTRSVELAAIGRRVAETEFDLLNLLAAGRSAGGTPLRELGDPTSPKGKGADRGNRWRDGIVTDLHNRPTAAELVAAVAEFLETDVRDGTTGPVNFHARVAANVLRTVERELLDDTAGEALAVLADLGFADESELAAAITRGEFDGRGAELLPGLRTLVLHRLAVAHPGYEHE